MKAIRMISVLLVLLLICTYISLHWSAVYDDLNITYKTIFTRSELAAKVKRDYVEELLSYSDKVKHGDVMKYRLKHITNLAELPLFEAKCYSTYKHHLPRKSLLKTARSTTLILDNFVPKSGCTSRKEFYKVMAHQNNFTTQLLNARVTAPWTRQHPDNAHMWYRKFKTLKIPNVIHGHQPFINFSRYNDAAFNPVYVNLFRDPVERFSSWYYYIQVHERRSKQRGMSLDDCISNKAAHCYQTPLCQVANVLFLCGWDKVCFERDNREALRRAMTSLKEKFAIIGVLEQYADFWAAMEWLFPKFFKGAYHKAIANEMKHRQVHNKGMSYTQPNETSLRWIKSVTQTDSRMHNLVAQRFNILLDYIDCIFNSMSK